jgi:hypothetical protein
MASSWRFVSSTRAMSATPPTYGTKMISQIQEVLRPVRTTWMMHSNCSTYGNASSRYDIAVLRIVVDRWPSVPER